jgi:hypothetical protein
MSLDRAAAPTVPTNVIKNINSKNVIVYSFQEFTRAEQAQPSLWATRVYELSEIPSPGLGIPFIRFVSTF